VVQRRDGGAEDRRRSDQGGCRRAFCWREVDDAATVAVEGT
jgi:hypothetical protein